MTAEPVAIAVGDAVAHDRRGRDLDRDAALARADQPGDGVLARIVSSRNGQLGEFVCEPTKTVGMDKTALIGRAGRFALGRPLRAMWEGFSSSLRTLPTASRWKRNCLV